MKHSTVVIKLGTSSIVHETTHQPLLSILAIIVETACALRKDGYKVVIVSSGAIGVALQMMNLARRPKHLPQVQALAAVGQCRLLGLWDQLFERLGQPIAQILLTRNDIADRTQYLNAQNTFNELLNMGVIPIVNENDTLSVAEIKFGDNDTLSAITAGMVQADYLFLMTDVDCLYDKNPRHNPDAKAIEVVEDISKLEADVSSRGSALGTGGMSTKIVAARLATAAGVTTIISKSSKPGNIHEIVAHLEAKKAQQRMSGPVTPLTNGQGPSLSLPFFTPSGSGSVSPAPAASMIQVPPAPLHTRFLPSSKPIGDRRFWLLHGLTPHGTIYIDKGAARALADHAGLLPVGIVDVDGTFSQQECVRIVEVTTTRPKHMHQRQMSSSNVPIASSPLAATPASSEDSSASNSGTTTPSLSRNPSSAAIPQGLRTPPINVAPSSLASDPTAREVGRALVNYAAYEIRRIAGLRSTEIVGVLGYADSEYVALRENVAMLDRSTSANSRPVTPDMGVLRDATATLEGSGGKGVHGLASFAMG